MRSIRQNGRWVLIGMVGGNTVDHIDLRDLMRKYVTISGTLLTPRSDEYKALLTKEFAEKVLPLFEIHKIKPIINKVFKLEDVSTAHKFIEDNKNIGKIILSILKENVD